MQRRLGGGSAGLYEWFVAELGLAIFGSYKVSKTLARALNLTHPKPSQTLPESRELRRALVLSLPLHMTRSSDYGVAVEQ